MPTNTRSAARTQAVTDLRTVNAELQRVSLPTWLQLGLPIAQLRALVALASLGGVSVTVLARSLRIGEPAASQLVEQLVQRDYAERAADAEDRRRVVVTATPAGAGLVSELQQGRSHYVERWLESMDGDDVDALARGLRALAVAALTEQDAPTDA